MEIQTLESGEQLVLENNYIQSVNPPETLFGYTYWSYMIPPVKPERMLILGYGNGTILDLTEKIWGKDWHSAGVDINDYDASGCFSVDFFQESADIFVKYCKDKYDYIVVDLYNGNKICDFVFQEDFVENLSKMCNGRLSINLFNEYFGQEKIYEKYFKRELEKNILNNRIVFFKKM